MTFLLWRRFIKIFSWESSYGCFNFTRPIVQWHSRISIPNEGGDLLSKLLNNWSYYSNNFFFFKKNTILNVKPCLEFSFSDYYMKEMVNYPTLTGPSFKDQPWNDLQLCFTCIFVCSDLPITMYSFMSFVVVWIRLCTSAVPDIDSWHCGWELTAVALSCHALSPRLILGWIWQKQEK